jgi:hypothetical protein
MRYPEHPVLSTIAAGLLLIPLPSQLRTRNIPAITLVLISFLLCVVNTANALVWDRHVRDVALAWCNFGEILMFLVTGSWQLTRIQPPLLSNRGGISWPVQAYALVDTSNGSHHPGVGSRPDAIQYSLRSCVAASSH